MLKTVFIHLIATKEQPPRKLSDKRTVHISSGKRIYLTEGVNLSGKQIEGIVS